VTWGSGWDAAATCTPCAAPRQRACASTTPSRPTASTSWPPPAGWGRRFFRSGRSSTFLSCALDAEGAGRFTHGSAVRVSGSDQVGRHLVFGDAGLLGIGLLRDGLLEPRTVIEGQGQA